MIDATAAHRHNPPHSRTEAAWRFSMSAYDCGYFDVRPDAINPFHYRHQRVFFNAWKKGRSDRFQDDVA